MALLSFFGLSRLSAVALALLAAAVPAAWFGGRWHQHNRDNVAAVQLELERTLVLLAKAKDDAAGIVLKQAEATMREREARQAAERLNEDQQANVAAIEARLNATLARLPMVPEPAPNDPAVPPSALPRGGPCDLTGDELRALNQAYPAGPIHHGRRPAGPAGRR